MGRPAVDKLEYSINEKEFILLALKQSARLDGRSVTQTRDLAFSCGGPLGTVECRLGQTRVLAVVNCEPVEPMPDRPSEGVLQIQVELTGMGSLTLETGRGMSDEEVILTRTMEKLFRTSRAVDTEGLCIVAGKCVWNVQVRVHILDDDGNLVDCSCLAVLAALLHFRRSDVTVLGEHVTVHGLDEKNPVPLSIHHMPLCVTFSLFDMDDGSLKFVTDPSLREEIVQAGAVRVGMNAHQELCFLSKEGGVPVPLDQINSLCSLAHQQVFSWLGVVQESVKADISAR